MAFVKPHRQVSRRLITIFMHGTHPEPVNPVETSGGLFLLWCHVRFDGGGGLVDPDSGGQPRRLGGLAEPAGAGGVGVLEDRGAAGLDLGDGAVVDGCGCVQADA
jgi:hypothetical protein